MKKYVKPELFYEHYELSQHIADCAWEWLNDEEEGVCIATSDPKLITIFGSLSYTLFMPDQNGCQVSDMPHCYQNGVANETLFKS